MAHPSFLVLANPIPISEMGELLGRIAVEYRNPLDISAPQTVSHVTADHLLEPIRSDNLSVLLNGTGSASGLAKLQSILEFASRKGFNQELDIKAAEVKTYRLKAHDQVLEALLADAQTLQQIDKIFSYAKGGFLRIRKQLYMVTGVKTLADNSKNLTYGSEKLLNGRLELPLKQIVQAIAPGAGLGTTNAGLQSHNENKADQKQSSTSDQEQIFAVEYRIISRRRFMGAKNPKKINLGSLKRFDFGNAVMGDSDDEAASDLPILDTDQAEDTDEEEELFLV